MGNICSGKKAVQKKAKVNDAWLNKPSLRLSKGMVFREAYKLTPQLLGQGRTSTVWIALDRETKKHVAVKRCSKKALSRRPPRMIGVSEIEILLKAHEGGSCDKIMRLIATYEDNKYLYLVSDICERGDLYAHIAAKPNFSEVDASLISRQILEALEHIHERNIVHRDLKPENIMFMKDTERIQLVDFGSAGIIGKGGKYLSDEIGTMFYMAPEIRRDRRYHSAVDIFSFGVVLYVMICGLKSIDIAKMDLNGNPIWLQFQSGNVPPLPENTSPALEDLLSKLLTLNMDERLTAKAALDHPWVSGRAYLQKDLLESSVGSANSIVQSRGKSNASSKIYYVQDGSNRWKLRRTGEPECAMEVWKKPPSKAGSESQANSRRKNHRNPGLPPKSRSNQHRFAVEVLEPQLSKKEKRKKAKSYASYDSSASEGSYYSDAISNSCEVSMYS